MHQAAIHDAEDAAPCGEISANGWRSGLYGRQSAGEPSFEPESLKVSSKFDEQELC